jgi:hypothetical protein
MKTSNVILTILLVAFLSISATIGVSKLSERSTSQVVIVKTDPISLITEMNKYYAKDYRVVFMVSQGWVAGHYYSSQSGKTTPVIVIMEK